TRRRAALFDAASFNSTRASTIPATSRASAKGTSSLNALSTDSERVVGSALPNKTLETSSATPAASSLCTRAVTSRASACCASLFRSEEHTSELQSLRHLVCRLLLEKKNYKQLKT